MKANTEVREVNRFALGEQVKLVTTKNKDHSTTLSEFSLDGKFLRERRVTANTSHAISFNDDMKTTVAIDAKGNIKTKLFGKDKNGKFKLIQSETHNKNGSQKLVEHLDDGNTKITISDRDKRVITVRDKKGKILSEEHINTSQSKPPDAPKQKVLAAWYVNYLQLCKKFGVQPRICGVSGGAWDHFYELNLRATDPEAYKSYLRLQSYRARYDEKAQLMEALRGGKLPISSLEKAAENKEYYGAISKLNEIEKAEELARQASIQSEQQQRVLVYA